ncbi:MAG: leucine-rich repeat protein [Clostridia bacterium]|nr:leucine-rich repeat protein [Clostridia bacterium]
MKTVFRLSVSLIVVLICACFFTACEKSYYEKEEVDSFIAELKETITTVETTQKIKIDELEAAYKADIAKLKEQNTILKSSIDELTEEYTQQVADLKSSDQAIDNKLAELKASYEAKVTDLNNRISDNTSKITKLEESLAEEISTIKTTYDAKIAEIENLITALQDADNDTLEIIAVLEERVEKLLAELPPNAKEHTWSDWTIVKAPNSVEDGLSQRFCADCNYTESKVLLRAEHNFVFTEVVAPAAVEKITLVYTCSHCDESYTEMVIPVHFEITSENRDLIGFTDEANENLVIPVVFYDKGVWYRVTSIGNWAFSGCDNLNTAIIPESVTNIGDGAFDSCNGLTSIVIPDSVTKIGKSAFWICDELKTVTIGNGVTSIGEDAFEHCEGLTSITLGNNVKSIGANAFSYCKNLESIVIPDSVVEIGSGAFEECRALETAIIGSGLTIIPSEMFYCCTSLSNITISNNVKEIKYRALYYCTGLESITYTGLTVEWNEVLKWSNWNENSGNYIVKCNDATVEK